MYADQSSLRNIKLKFIWMKKIQTKQKIVFHTFQNIVHLLGQKHNFATLEKGLHVVL